MNDAYRAEVETVARRLHADICAHRAAGFTTKSDQFAHDVRRALEVLMRGEDLSATPT